MTGKRKAGDDIKGPRHRAARQTEEPTALTSAQTSGPTTANAAGDGIAVTSPAMRWLLAVTSGYPVDFSQFDGAAPGAEDGSGYRGFSQSQAHGRAPQMPSQGMRRPPLGNPAGGRRSFTNQYHGPTGHGSLSGQTQNHAAVPTQTGNGQTAGSLSGQTQNNAADPRQTVPEQPAGSLPGQTQNHAAGPRQTETEQPAGSLPGQTQNHAAGPRQTGTEQPAGSLSGQTQNHATGPRQTGTGQPCGNSGDAGGQPSSAVPCASAPGAPVSSLDRLCTLCKRSTTGVWGLVPLCVDCYNKLVTNNVPPQHPETPYAPPVPVPSFGGATQGQGIAIGDQRQPDLGQPSYAGLARTAVGPLTMAPSADMCCVCVDLELTMWVLGTSPLCEACYNCMFVDGEAPPQHAQTGYVLPSQVPSYAGAPQGTVPASEQQYQAAAIRPSSGPSSSLAVGSGPICQACGHPSGAGNRACGVCNRNGSPPPGLG